MVLAIALVLLVIGSVLFHYLSPWYFQPIASNWSSIDDTVTVTFWVTGFVFVVVNVFMAYCVLRYRRRKGSQAHYEPESKKLEGALILATTVGVIAMLAPGLFAWAKFIEVPKEAAVVEVVGRQWYFNYRFPGKDGVLGTVDAKFVSDENPFGINPDDPSGQDDILVTTQQLHLPVGKPVKLELRAIDVLHDFTVPQFRSKMNMVPGLVTYVWFTPTRTGTFEAFCEQLCGIAHFAMRGKVIVEEESAFQAWLASYPTFAQTQARVAGDAEAGKTLYAVCAACHGAQGEGNPSLNAPKLAGQGDWYLKRQLRNFKNGTRGTDEKDVSGKTMAPMAATLADDAAIDNVVAYIKTLPDNPAPLTVNGNAKSGHDAYVTCGACHGDNARGIQAMNAPRLKGMSDWYLVTQLKNFRGGIRGAHPNDVFGRQMGFLAAVLTDQQAADVVSYVDTLR
ncbi:MAG TPA: c-type cytochrome [Casimicrobiaceae bacterium]|nr:c-type cytochrome [Casimicrobiaceae bacterium]